MKRKVAELLVELLDLMMLWVVALSALLWGVFTYFIVAEHIAFFFYFAILLLVFDLFMVVKWAGKKAEFDYHIEKTMEEDNEA